MAMYKLIFFAPATHKELVKQAVFAQGAGRYQHYEQCSWEVLGSGQFKPLPQSQPFIGEQDKLEQVAEYRVEMICSAEYLDAVLQALIAAHPYEEPAYEFFQINQQQE